MAGKGGGAWKVAYADFVTAMMAFFLVMWLISQDQKIKESIAHYFNQPVGWRLSGNTKNPNSAGNLFERDFAGPVPGSRNRSVGSGIGNAEEPDFDDTDTTVVADWLLQQPGDSQKWEEEGRRKLEWAKKSFRRTDTGVTVDEIARKQLAIQMRTEVIAGAMAETQGIYQDLLLTTLSKVNWDLIAEECLGKSGVFGNK